MDLKFKERKMYSQEDLDSPFNKVSSFMHKELSGEAGVGKLSSVTHIVDCECFQISGDKIYREISIFDLEKLQYDVLQCYAEDYCSFHYLTNNNKKSVKFAFKIHGLFYLTTPVNENFFSQEEMFRYLKNKYFYKKIFYSDIKEGILSLFYFVN